MITASSRHEHRNGSGPQLGLFDPAPVYLHQTNDPVTPVTGDYATIQEKFEAFHAANPHVFDAIVGLAFEARSMGVQSYGMKGIFEELRWRYAMQTRGDVFKLNNIFTSRYARLVMDTVPELDGFFEVRELKAD